MSSNKQRRQSPPRCPQCNEKEALEVTGVRGRTILRTIPTYEISCRACGYRWWSTHSALADLTFAYLEKQGQTRIFPLDSA